MEREDLERIRDRDSTEERIRSSDNSASSLESELETIERDSASKREAKEDNYDGNQRSAQQEDTREVRENADISEESREIDSVVVSKEEKQIERQVKGLNEDQIGKLKSSLGLSAGVSVEAGDSDIEEQKEQRRLLKAKLMEMPPEEASKLIEEARSFKSSYKFKQKMGGTISAEVLEKVFLQAIDTETPYDFKQDWDAILKENQKVRKFLSHISSEKENVAKLNKLMKDKEFFNPDYVEIKNIWVHDSSQSQFKKASLDGLKFVNFSSNPDVPEKYGVDKESAWIAKIFKQQGLEQIEAGLLEAGEDYEYKVPDIEEQKNLISKSFLNSSRILRKYCGVNVKDPQAVVKSIFTISTNLLNLDDREAVNDFLTSFNELIEMMSNVPYRVKLQSFEDYLDDVKEFFSQENFEVELGKYAKFSDMLEETEKDASASASYQEEKLALNNDIVANEDLLAEELSKLRLKLIGGKITEAKENAEPKSDEQVAQPSELSEKYLTDTTEISRKTAESLAYAWVREAISEISKDEGSLARAVLSKNDYLAEMSAESDFDKILATFTKDELLHKSVFNFSKIATIFGENNKQAVIEIDDEAIETDLFAKYKETLELMMVVIRRSAFSPKGTKFTDELIMKNMLDMCQYSGKFMILDADTKADMSDFGFELSCIEDNIKAIEKLSPLSLSEIKKALSIRDNAQYPYYKDWIVRAFTIESQAKKDAEKSEQKQKDAQKNNKQKQLDTSRKLLAIKGDTLLSDDEKKSKLKRELEPIGEEDLNKIIDAYQMTGSITGDTGEKKSSFQSRVLKLDEEQVASLEMSWNELEKQAETQENQEATPTYRLFQNDPYLRDITGNVLEDDEGTPYMKMDLFNSNGEIIVNPTSRAVMVMKASNYDQKLHGVPDDYTDKNDANSMTLTNFGELTAEQQSEFKMQFTPEESPQAEMPREAEMYLTDTNNFTIAKYICEGLADKARMAVVKKEKTEEELQDEVMQDSFSLCDSSKQPIKNKSGYAYNINDLKFKQFTYYVDKKKKMEEELN